MRSSAGVENIRSILGDNASTSSAILDLSYKGRDPFKRPEISVDQLARKKTDLENYQLEQLKFVAVTSGPDRITGLMLAPDGKSHFIRERMKIGPNEGVVKKIGAEGLIVQEKFTNVLGELETLETIIPLQAEKIAENQKEQALMSNILSESSAKSEPQSKQPPQPTSSAPSFGGGGDLLKNISQAMSPSQEKQTAPEPPVNKPSLPLNAAPIDAVSKPGKSN
ncbi:MAG: pilus assembly protein PilP [Bdellovibrionota bacterium]